MVELEISYNITKKEKIAIRFIGLYYLKKMKDVYIWTWRLKKEWKILHNIIYFVSRNQTSISAKKINVKMSTYYSYFQKSRKTRTTFASRASDCRFVEQNYTETKKVAKPSVARQSSDGHTTIDWLSGNFFSTFQPKWQNFEKKSLNSHATDVGGHATVSGLSDNFLQRFKQFGKILRQSLNADLFDRAESKFVRTKFDE